MRVFVQTELPCTAEAAWREVQTSRLLVEVSQPMVALSPADGAATLPIRWDNLGTVRFVAKLWGIIPWGVRQMTLERIDPRRRQIQTREFDALIARWDHLIAVEPIGEASCRYSDEIEIRAGLLTPFAWLFAQLFYRHRQRRWQVVARRLAAPESLSG